MPIVHSLSKYFLFAGIFIYITLWTQIWVFATSLGTTKPPITTIEDARITQIIKEKTVINIPKTHISETDSYYGMMVGIPTQPQLILSRSLYDNFSPDELEYVLMHEAGHYKLWHNVTELIIGLILLIAGIFILKKFALFPYSLSVAICLGLIMGIFMIQLGKINEIQADRFALEKMTNPQGMISASDIFKSHFRETVFSRNPVFKFLFYRGNSYANRIKMAEEEIRRRTQE